jgi:hypothetical protein
MNQYEHSSGAVRGWAKVNVRPRTGPLTVSLALGVAFVGAFAIAMLQAEKPFFNDAGGYWQLGTTFTANGHFSLLNFSDPVKAYAWPLVTHLLQVLASEFGWTASFVAKLFNVVLLTLIGTVLGPALIQTVWPSQPRWGFVRRIALSGLLLVFWSGFLNFPLSDFPALAAAVLTLVAVARVDSPRWMFVAGAALALALDIREAYLPFVPAVLAIIVWAWFEQRGTQHASTAHRVLCGGCFLVAFAAISLPQSLSAHRYHGTWSFVPGASVAEPLGEFYGAGFETQAYDTFVVNGEARVSGKYVFPAGKRLLEEQKEDKVTTTNQYVGLYTSHPLVAGDMLVRHIVNGLDPLYSTPFVENLHNEGRSWGRIGGFLLVFIALLRLLWPAARRLLGPARLRYFVALAACCLTTVPTQMERRYMLPVYLLVYIVALTPRWPNPIGSASMGAWRRFQTPAVIVVAFLVFAGVVWYITNDAISHLVLT